MSAYIFHSVKFMHWQSKHSNTTMRMISCLHQDKPKISLIAGDGKGFGSMRERQWGGQGIERGRKEKGEKAGEGKADILFLQDYRVAAAFSDGRHGKAVWYSFSLQTQYCMCTHHKPWEFW